MQSLTCPNCGAPATNHKNCEFCGSLLVRFADKKVDLSNTNYLKNTYVFPGLEEELQKNIELQNQECHRTDISIKNEVGEEVATISIIPSNEYCSSNDTKVFPNSEGGISVAFTFDFYKNAANTEVKKRHDKFKGLKSIMLFTLNITEMCYQTVSEDDPNAVWYYYNRYEYAIDFGHDSEGAARLISEIIHEVYNIPYNTHLSMETISFSEYSKRLDKQEEDFNKTLHKAKSKVWRYIIIAVILNTLILINMCS